MPKKPKNQKRRAFRPEATKAGVLRYFRTGQAVTYSNSLGQTESGKVICQHDKTGQVRIQNQATGGELWLPNNAPTPA